MGGHIVLVVENPEMHAPLIQGLASDGYCALCFHSVEEATAYLGERNCPAYVAVFNIPMRRQNDLAAVAQLSQQRPELQILFAGQQPNPLLDKLTNANRAIWMLEKPLNHPESGLILRKILTSAAIVAAEISTDISLDTETAQAGSITPYSEEFLRRVGMAEVPVLLSGETGVGKEVMARRLCAYSSRAAKPFLKLNCAALPAELAESELFGSTKGAFTGALVDRPGRFETAHGGTILLDEIGDMDLRLQTKLLHVLQDGEIQPLGSNRTIQVNVRVMAATHRDLTRAIQEGTFREDLYYRLNVIRIVIPPLRDRRDEILPLAEALLTRHSPPGFKRPAIKGDLKRFLLEYSWPGNIRELENVMRRFLVYQDAKMLIHELRNAASETSSGIPVSVPVNGPVNSAAAFSGSNHALNANEQVDNTVGKSSHAPPGGRLDRLAEASRTAEIELLLTALKASRWNRRQAAESLQIEYKAFLYKLQKYGIVESKGKRREISA
ncbi:sigma-54 interaction domain-containing protein [Acidicapsa ligni]|uniref:sigma-54 interaction domain-containing protein n=1 Tax=Acidicapsa ligni TaxID=542300 RepID=UPI0021E0EB8E|nr:sigma-54 dependent transcriptional regulator [Acidicapsa ligni]